MKRLLLTGLALTAFPAAPTMAQAPAAAPAPAGPMRVEGKVTALSDAGVTLAKADGTSVTVALLPNRTVTVVAPLAIDRIVPGSYVATANKSQADGSGVSIEIRVFPPETPRFDVNRVMDAGAGTMMTNGKVATAVSSDGGRSLTVDYGSGQRKIVVPPNIPVLSITPGTTALVKVGLPITLTTFAATGDRPARQSIAIAKADLGG